MATQTATIVNIIDQDTAEAEVMLAPLTDHACCGPQRSSMKIRVKARNAVGAKVGDTVLLESASAVGMLSLVTVLLIPIALSAVGYALWPSWGAALGLLGLPISVIICKKTTRLRMNGITAIKE
jgi:hypothetical protein